MKWSLLALVSGVLSGVAASVFLILLDIATKTRDAHPEIIWFLPIAGFFLGWIYFRFGKDIAAGNNLILEEIHNPKRTVPILMAPFILLGTVITHLFGGSAGREGTAVQMGASLSDQLSRIFHIEHEERKILLVTGAGAGFGAAIGAPWAGILFGMEVIQIGRLKPFAVMECAIASFAAYTTSILLHAPHTIYPTPAVHSIELRTAAWIAVAGLLFGIVARIFSVFTHAIERTQTKWISFPPLKPFLAGLVLIGLFAWEGSYRYIGLGIPFIQDALTAPAPYWDPIFKLIFTAITVASGFKGGEFIPLVFIGTTFGSTLSQWIPVSFDILAAVGFAAVFAAASNTPLTCTIMAMEIFGFKIGMYALVACYLSYYVSGQKGIYRSQKKTNSKLDLPLRLVSYLGELPQKFFKRSGH